MERPLKVCRGHSKVSLWVQRPRHPPPPRSYLWHPDIPDQSHATDHGDVVRLQSEDCPFGVTLSVRLDGWVPPSPMKDGTSQSFCISLLSTHLDVYGALTTCGVFYDNGLSLQKERYALAHSHFVT